MSDQAQRRISAIGQQLKSDLPPITRVAAGSSSLRAKGKVVIITGKALLIPLSLKLKRR